MKRHEFVKGFCIDFVFFVPSWLSFVRTRHA